MWCFTYMNKIPTFSWYNSNQLKHKNYFLGIQCITTNEDFRQLYFVKVVL